MTAPPLQDQNDRTILSWQRTMLAAVGCGLVLGHRTLVEWSLEGAGLTRVLLAGVTVALVGCIGVGQSRRRRREGGHQVVLGPRSAAGLAFGLGAVAVVALWVT